jgi:hypothetical protein
MSKPKRVLYELIKPTDTFLSGLPYELLAEIRAEHHFDTSEAKIALAWKKGTKPDVDGHILLGRCVKASDLQREFVDFDFVIVLNQEIWEDPEFDREKKLALLDHEMTHVTRVLDVDGEPVVDTKNRPVWRVRKHDIEEFTAVISRHGCYKRDLEQFAEALQAKKKVPLFNNETSSGTLRQDSEILGALDRMTTSVRSGEVKSMTLSTSGMNPVVIDQASAKRIHQHAQRAGTGK